jgi:hypothetical protein
MMNYAWEHIGGHAWLVIERGVDKLSITQTAAIGGTGSVVSLATAAAPDFTALNAYLQTAALGAGALGAFLSVGLILLKGWLELRHRAPPKE